MASGYLNSPEYLQWKYQQEAAMQQQPLYSPFATIAKALQGGLATYGGKKSQAEYDAKQAKNASLLASLLQKQPVDTVAGTPSLINDTGGGAEYQSRKDLGAYDQPTSQSPDNSQILAGLLTSGNQDAISQYVPGIAQAQLEANARANEPPTQLQRMQLGLDARRLDPNYLGQAARAQRITPEEAGAQAGAVSQAQLPGDLEKQRAAQTFTAGQNELSRANAQEVAGIRAGSTGGNVQSVQQIQLPGGQAGLLTVYRNGEREVTTIDGKPVVSSARDAAALYNQGAATAAGKASGTQAEGEPVLDANFEVINKALTAFDDPAVKAQAPKAIGFGSILPTVPGQNSEFRARVGQLQGQAFLQAYQTLRGGGQITEVEGSKATEAIARLNKAQTPTEFYKALGEAKTTFKTIYDAAKVRAARGRAAVPQLQNMPSVQQQGGGAPSPADIDAELRRRGVLK